MDSVTMSVWDGLIQGGIAAIICGVAAVIIKIFIPRTFKGIDDKINAIEQKVTNTVPATECKLKMDKCEKLETKANQASDDIIRLQEATKVLDSLKEKADNIDKLRVEFLEKYQPKADFIREMQILNSQLESAHKMITRLDEKIESIKRGSDGK